MKIINYNDALKPYWDKRKKAHKTNVYNFTKEEYIKTILEIVNNQCAKGYRFITIVTSDLMVSSGFFIFEESDRSHKYIVRLDDEVREYYAKQKKMGRIPLDTDAIRLYNSFGNIHAVIELNAVVQGRPFFFIDISDDTDAVDTAPEKLALYDEYQKLYNKNAVWRGEETKGFLEWLQEKE